jgi:hypothetical protein
MLNERTASMAEPSLPEDGPRELTVHNQLIAASLLLAQLPWISEPSVTVNGWSIQFQFSHASSTEVFPAVASVAALIEASTELRTMGDGSVHFSTEGSYLGTQVQAFASDTLAIDPVRAEAGHA